MTEYGNGGGYTVTMDGPFGGGGGGSSSEKMISIHAPVSDWKGATSPYSQVVEVYGLNIGSKVDIQISTQLLEQLSQQRIWFTAENRGGVVTLFAVGDKPAIDCEFQATLSDVVNITGEDIEAIRGNTVSTVIPQGDFAQKDPNKSDFIKNKPAPFVVSNEKPEGSAIWFNKKENLDDTTGDAHIMAHDLDMGQHKLRGLNTPTEDDEAATKGSSESFTNTQITDRVIYGKGKNLLKNTLKSQTKNGVTFTVNDDGSVTVNGTATENDAQVRIEYALDAGTYIANGGLKNDQIYAEIYKNWNWYGYVQGDIEFAITERTTIRYAINVTKGSTVNNITIYPMIRLATETDDTYEPYYEGLVELTNRGMELLWENASPTSEFGQQTINLDLSQCSFLRMLCKSHKDAKYYSVHDIAVNNTECVFFGVDNDIYDGAIMTRSAVANPSQNTILIYAAYFYQSYAVPNKNNEYMIPVAIYGIKGAF